MIKYVIRSLGISAFGSKKTVRQPTLLEQAEEMAAKSRALAEEMDGSIRQVKRALVQLFGEFCIGLTDLQRMCNTRDSMDAEISSLIKGSTDESNIKAKIRDLHVYRANVDQFTESLNILVRQINLLQNKLNLHESTKSQALLKASITESRARFSATIEQISGVIIQNTSDSSDLSDSLDRFDAYNSAYEKVYLQDEGLDSTSAEKFAEAVEQEFQARLKDIGQ